MRMSWCEASDLASAVRRTLHTWVCVQVVQENLEITDEDRDRVRMIASTEVGAGHDDAFPDRAQLWAGMSNSEIARKLRITGATVGKWRERFRQFGAGWLQDEPRVRLAN